MPLIKTRCPNAACTKPLRLNIKDGVTRVNCRCPSCRHPLAIALKSAKPAPRRVQEEEEGGSYGLAQETNLGYLLQREQDGFKLTAEEKSTKKKLIQQKLDDDPGRCPACDARMSRRDILCLKCGLDLNTGKRLTTKVEQARSRHEGGEIVIDLDVVETVLDVIITLADNA